MPTKTFIVTDGPSDDEIVDAFKYVHDLRHPRFTVEFRGHWEDQEVILAVPSRVYGLMAGSGNRGQMFVQVGGDFAGNGQSIIMVGEYDSRTRKGTLSQGYFSFQLGRVSRS